MNRIEYQSSVFDKWMPSAAPAWSQVGKHPYTGATYREVSEEGTVMREWHPAEGNNPAREITYQHPPPAPKHTPPEVPNLLAVNAKIQQIIDIFSEIQPLREPAIIELIKFQKYLESAK